ncbi:MAG: hypothetical protein LBV28_01085, partial [Puniceicoccales bacterium]|nr:hypothetical protein [Puniceicoccales bacterium]
MHIPSLFSPRRLLVFAAVLFAIGAVCVSSANADDPIVTILRDGKPIVDLTAASTRQPIEIHRASYGPRNAPAHTRDATGAVRELVAEGRDEISVAEITRRVGDPIVGTVKTLTIEFSRGGTRRTATAQDNGTVSLAAAKPVADGTDIAFDFNSISSDLLIRTAGNFGLGTTDGSKIFLPLSGFSTALKLDGEWAVQFPDKKEITFPALTSWHTSTDDSIKYFSGTATYRKTFRLPENLAVAVKTHSHRIELDLGEVHEIAEVILNGRPLGVLWKQEKKLDVTFVLRLEEENTLEIRVTNLWPNRLIGDQFIPASDEARKSNGTLSRWPQWLLDGKKDPSGRQTFSMWNLWSKSDALLPSGLLGPVYLRDAVTVSTPRSRPFPSSLADGFTKPAPEYRPWVYWFWNNGNLTKEGVTADLEAMAAVGIGGVLIMDVGQGAPRGAVQFLSDEWREIFRFVISESKRLGIEVNMNNDAGWNGSGGAWITPAESMQMLTFSETTLTAPVTEKIFLSQPSSKLDYYRDIAVLAFPTPENAAARSRPNADQQRPTSKTVKNPVVAHKDIVVLTGRLAADGTLDWTPPASGKWTLLRVGHTSKNKRVAPAPQGADGLECDKLSIAASVAAFEGQIGRLVAENKDGTGKTFVSTHIDSWENGSQTWT